LIRRNRFVLAAIVGIALLGAAVLTIQSLSLPPPPDDEARSAWATPIELEGVSNFFKVTEDLYRGEQPTTEGMKNLQKMGIKTIINLRLLHSDDEKLEATNLQQVDIRVEAWDADEDEVIDFLKVATDPARQPVFVHCKHGADRTWMMCAIYRMVVNGWDRTDAIQEMTRGDFGYHRIWKDLVRYLERVDVERLRQDAGITELKPAPRPMTERTDRQND
jgi:protein tyrosine/serine phosphatase